MKMDFKGFWVKRRLKKSSNAFKVKLIVLFALMINSAVFAAVPEKEPVEERVIIHKFDKTLWQEIGQEMQYDVEKEPDRRSFDGFPSLGLTLGPILQIVLFSVLIGVLVFVIFRLLNNRLFNRKIIEQQAVDKQMDLVENIHDIDLNALFSNAINNQDYKMAMRVYYLIIIKKLAEQDQIIWKKDKTNWEYIKEMKNREGYNAFRNITNVFEKIWYGNIDLKRNTFERVMEQFEQFNRKLSH